MVDGYGIPLGRVLAGANRHDSPLLAPTLDKLDDLGPLPDDITVHLDAGYDSAKTREELAGRDMVGEIAHKGDKAPVQAGQRWQVERTKCAARRSVVSPVQPGGTRREVPGSNGLPGSER
jgi:IS5 family transposase